FPHRVTFTLLPSEAYALSHAPASPPLSTFVWFSGLRWAIAPCFEEGKPELGMDHDAVRKYAGGHHQRLTTMLAQVFLWHLKRRLGKKSASPHWVAAAAPLGGRLTAADGDD